MVRSSVIIYGVYPSATVCECTVYYYNVGTIYTTAPFDSRGYPSRGRSRGAAVAAGRGGDARDDARGRGAASRQKALAKGHGKYSCVSSSHCTPSASAAGPEDIFVGFGAADHHCDRYYYGAAVVCAGPARAKNTPRQT